MTHVDVLLVEQDGDDLFKASARCTDERCDAVLAGQIDIGSGAHQVPRAVVLAPVRRPNQRTVTILL